MAPANQRPELVPTDLGDGQDLARLPPTARDTLLRKLSDTRGGTLLAQLGRAESVAKLLASLSGEELYTAAALAFVAKASGDRLHEHLSLRLGADGAVKALDGVLRSGLAVRSQHEPRTIWMPPTLQMALRPSLAGVLAHEGHPPPLEGAEHDLNPRLFEDLVLVAALAGIQPKLTQSGEVFKRELLPLQERFARRFHDSTLLAEEIDLLCDLGLVSVGSRLEVPKEAIEAWDALPRPEKLRRHALARSRSIPTLAPLWHLLLLCEAVPLLTLVELAELDASAEPVLWRRGRERFLDGPTRIDLLLLQPGVGIADVARVRLVGLSASLREALRGEGHAEPTESVPPHLLPSLEAIVPPECPAGLLVDLGRFLELEAIDTVARLKLTRESVEQAAQRGLTVEAMLECLRTAAPHGVPDNVARAVSDFAQQRPSVVEVVEGPVVVVLDRARIELVRADPELKTLLRELIPGVFEFSGPQAIAPARKRLVTMGFWRPREEEINATPRLTEWDTTAAGLALRSLQPRRRREGGDQLARRARAAVELTSLGPAQVGASERMTKAQAKLEADPEAYAKFVASLSDAERAELQPKLERLLDPDKPVAEQLAVLDRVVPEWFLRVKPRRRKTSSG